MPSETPPWQQKVTRAVGAAPDESHRGMPRPLGVHEAHDHQERSDVQTTGGRIEAHVERPGSFGQVSLYAVRRVVEKTAPAELVEQG